MSNEVIVAWNNSYSVGIESIDKQHVKLIELTNKLFTSCMKDNEKTTSGSIFFNIIHEVKNYICYHFITEERLMKRIDYPKYKKHRQEHVTLFMDILDKIEEFKLGKINTALSFVHYLRDWVLNHIAISDKQLGIHLADMEERDII